MKSRRTNNDGFTLVELIATAGIITIIAGMAVPLLMNVAASIKLGQAAREVERELQDARLQAVQTNQPMRVRFDCPKPGTYRMVELVGTSSVPAAADNAADRCYYPFPADTDRNPLTRPNFDGPIRYLDPTVSFSVSTTIEFWPDGTAHVNMGADPWSVIGGTPQNITLTRYGTSKTITVNGIGKIQVQ